MSCNVGGVPDALWNAMGPDRREQWQLLQKLQSEGPKTAGGKPSPEVIQALKAHKAEVKALEASFGAEAVAELKAFDKARKDAARPPRAANCTCIQDAGPCTHSACMRAHAHACMHASMQACKHAYCMNTACMHAAGVRSYLERVLVYFLYTMSDESCHSK